MPIYEYQCGKCDHKLEALQKISDDPLLECPACHEESLKKLVSAASFRLKGAGWYETDFKTGDKKQLAESESAANGGKESKEGSAKSGSDKSSDSGKSASGGKEKPAGKESKQSPGGQGKSANTTAKAPAADA